MDKQYSRMSPKEIEEEIAELRVLAQKAEAKGMINEYAVHERKIIMAEAYLLDPAMFKPREKYQIKGTPEEVFTIRYLNGVFAWGHRNDASKLEAVPISILENRMQ
ncbi:YfhH family protein [Alkalicoccus daliensis]|nr:YfhH family protein [Alkalicoccus daliensis]